MAQCVPDLAAHWRHLIASVCALCEIFEDLSRLSSSCVVIVFYKHIDEIWAEALNDSNLIEVCFVFGKVRKIVYEGSCNLCGVLIGVVDRGVHGGKGLNGGSFEHVACIEV